MRVINNTLVKLLLDLKPHCLTLINEMETNEIFSLKVSEKLFLLQPF